MDASQAKTRASPAATYERHSTRNETAAQPDTVRLCQSLRASVLRQAERLQRWLIDRRSDCKTVVGLERRQCPACLRPKASIDRSCIVAFLLQCKLEVLDDPVRPHICITSVDWSIVRIPSVRVIAPRRIPVPGVPVPPSAQHEGNVRVVTHPPTAVMPYPVVVVECGVVPREKDRFANG